MTTQHMTRARSLELPTTNSFTPCSVVYDSFRVGNDSRYGFQAVPSQFHVIPVIRLSPYDTRACGAIHAHVPDPDLARGETSSA